MSKPTEKQKRLADALEDHSEEGIAILLSEPSRLIRATIYLMASAILAAMIWAFFGRVDVIVKAQGQVIPDSEVLRVFAPVEGQLVDIRIAEGVPVSKGDVLARVNSVGAIQLATQAMENQLKLASARAAYEMWPRDKEQKERLITELQRQIAAEERIYEKLESESIAKFGEEQKLKLEKAQNKFEKTRRQMAHAERVWKKHVRLFNSPGGGGVSQSVVLEKKNEYLSKRSDFQLAKVELGQFEVQTNKEFLEKQKLIEAKAQDIARLRTQVDSNTSQLDSQELQIQAQLRLARAAAEGAARVTYEDIDEDNFLQIRAPVSGIITNLTFTHAGAGLDRKTPIAAIAPEDTSKVIEIEIAERDRAFLQEGMETKIKVSAFSFQRYGFISGKLNHISPNTVISQKTKQPVYKGRVTLDRTYYEVRGVRYPLRYGMTATTEIVVRKRRLIDLALDPFRDAIG